MYGFTNPNNVQIAADPTTFEPTHPPILILTLFGFVNPYGTLDDPLGCMYDTLSEVADTCIKPIYYGQMNIKIDDRISRSLS